MSDKTDEEYRAESQKDWSFTSVDTYNLVGVGDVFMVECPISCYNFDWLTNKPVKINGKDFKVVGVDRFAKKKISKGELIGIMVHSMNY